MSEPAATTWVLLRGLGRSARHWGAFPQALQQAWPGSRVLCPDLPGNGRLHAQPSPTQVCDLTEALRRQLRSQDVQKPVRVLALSLGAMVACDWAQRHPQELQALVLVNTSLRPFHPFWWRLQPRAWPMLAGVAVLPDEWQERIIFALTRRQGGDAEATLRHWMAARQAEPVRALNLWRQLLAASRYRSPATAPPVPIRVLAGLGDRLVDPRCSQDLARRWRCDHAWHPWAGHDLPLDDAGWLLAQLRRGEATSAATDRRA